MIGIDEVGRGCWAGPLLIVAARSRADLPVGLKDSKKLLKTQREKLFESIKASCNIGEGWVSNAEIDALGLTEAMRLGVARALDAMSASTDEEIIMDGLINYCDEAFKKVTCVARADDLYPIVSAASIYAKVMRDNYMTGLKGEYTKYQFDKHVGYGTKLHSELLAKFGVSDLHRLSFAPMNKISKV